MVLPDYMALGEKDAQQLRVLRRMVRDLNFPVEIIPGPIVREADGLAMSSRNKYLSTSERVEAVCLSRGLEKAKALVAAGEYHAEALKKAVHDIIEQTSGMVDYIELVDDETLRPVEYLSDPALLALAVKFSHARLIDNTVLRK
jgi:pantoate--beta-alanine ligase